MVVMRAVASVAAAVVLGKAAVQAAPTAEVAVRVSRARSNSPRSCNQWSPVAASTTASGRAHRRLSSGRRALHNATAQSAPAASGVVAVAATAAEAQVAAAAAALWMEVVAKALGKSAKAADPRTGWCIHPAACGACTATMGFETRRLQSFSDCRASEVASRNPCLYYERCIQCAADANESRRTVAVGQPACCVTA